MSPLCPQERELGGGGGRSEKLSRRQRIANCLCCCRRPKPPPEPEAVSAAGNREKSLMGESCTDLYWSPNSVMCRKGN